MESRNPEEELPDTRSASEKLRDEGNEPNPEPTESLKKAPPKEDSIDTEEERKEMVNSASTVNDLMQMLDGISVKSIEDLYHIKEMLIQFENKVIYEGR